MAQTKTFNLEKYRDLDVKSITIRPLGGRDTLDAAARCIAPDGKPIDPNSFGLMLRNEVLAQSVTEFIDINGQKIQSNGSCRESLDWNYRTREFLGDAFDYINGVDEDERADFKKALIASGA